MGRKKRITRRKSKTKPMVTYYSSAIFARMDAGRSGKVYKLKRPVIVHRKLLGKTRTIRCKYKVVD